MNAKRYHISQPNLFTLCNWYKEHQEVLLKTTDEVAAKQAQEKHGFTVISRNIETARKVLGIEKMPRRAAAPPPAARTSKRSCNFRRSNPARSSPFVTTSRPSWIV